MYVVNRKPGEAIVIDETVTVHVLDITGSRVKLGVVAPKEVRVRRDPN